MGISSINKQESLPEYMWCDEISVKDVYGDCYVHEFGISFFVVGYWFNALVLVIWTTA